MIVGGVTLLLQDFGKGDFIGMQSVRGNRSQHPAVAGIEVHLYS